MNCWRLSNITVGGFFTPLLTLAGLLMFSVPVSSCFPIVSSARQATIRLDAVVTHQTISGWEATAQAGQDESPPAFNSYRTKLFDQAVNDLGINRLRVEVRSGAENIRDTWGEYRSGKLGEKEWDCLQYSTRNDNDDPFKIDWSGFNFTELDRTIETIVLPMEKILKAKGEKLLVNLNYVAFLKRGCPELSYHHLDSPDEYAEFILAVYLHLKEKYGIVPDFCEIILEPDNTEGWRGQQIGRAIVATGERLKENGLTTGFIAPSCTNAGNTVTYFDEMTKVPGALPYLFEISYHLYGGRTDANLRAIGDRARSHGVDSSMLEFIGADYQMLHNDLKVGGVSSWQQYTLAYPTKDNGAQYYTITTGPQGQPILALGSRTKFLRQYFKFVKPGAIRIEAKTDNGALDPVAFINTDGTYVVVIKADGAGEMLIEGLAAGTYGIKYTTEDRYDVDLPAKNLESRQGLSASIPARGVITIYGEKARP